MMTPEQAIQAQILRKLSKGKTRKKITKKNVDALWDELDLDVAYDELEEFRGSGEETGLPTTTWSRHYECEHVARVLDDGTCVGWVYWHGGGKHGEPQSIDWLSSAEFLHFKTEEQLIEITTFSREPFVEESNDEINRKEWIEDLKTLMEKVMEVLPTFQSSVELVEIEENDGKYQAPSLIIYCQERKIKAVPKGTNVLGLFIDSSGISHSSVGRVDFVCGSLLFTLLRFAEGSKWRWLESKEDLNDDNLRKIIHKLC